LKKTLLFVMDEIGYGGAPKMICAVANYLATQSNCVYFYTYENNLIRQPMNSKILHIKCNKNYKLRGIRRIIQIIEIKKVISILNPDAIISFTDYPNLLTLLAATGINVPVIISERGDPYFRATGWFHKFRIFIYQFAEGLVFQTEGAKDFFKDSIRRKGVVIPNPVIIENLPERWEGEVKDEIAFVSRFEMITKRHDVMLNAFKKVLSKHPDIKLVFYGDGEDKDKVENMVLEMGLSKNVVFAGVTDNVCEAIRYAKIFALSSDYEGIPNSLIEAMSVGLPCISTDCSPGGARLLIENMKNGILVPRGDADALAEGMLFLLDNEEIRKSFGNEAMKIIDKFDVAKVMNCWDRYIDDIICKRG